MSHHKHLHVEVTGARDGNGWAIRIEGREAIVVPKLSAALEIAEEIEALAGQAPLDPLDPVTTEVVH